LLTSTLLRVACPDFRHLDSTGPPISCFPGLGQWALVLGRFPPLCTLARGARPSRLAGRLRLDLPRAGSGHRDREPA
jgi:hypothetical protein